MAFSRYMAWLNALRAVVVATTVLALGNSAFAIPFVYQVTGSASGSLGNSTFVNNGIKFVGIGDTETVYLLPNPLSVVLANPLQLLQVTISGIGTANASDPFEFFVNQTRAGAGFNNLNAADSFDFSSPTFATYSPASSLAPLAVASSFSAPFATSNGVLTISSASNLVFTAHPLSAVPEPDALALTSIGLLLLLGRRLKSNMSRHSREMVRPSD